MTPLDQFKATMRQSTAYWLADGGGPPRRPPVRRYPTYTPPLLPSRPAPGTLPDDLSRPPGPQALPRPRAKVPDAPRGQHYAICAICVGLVVMSRPPAGEIRCRPCAANIAVRVEHLRQGLRVVA